MIRVKIKNFGEKTYPTSTSLREIGKDVFAKDYYKYLACRIDNEIYHLGKKLDKDSQVEFIGTDDGDGYRVYTRTITAVFILAAKKLYPDRKVRVDHFLGAGLYVSFEGDYSIGFSEIQEIQKEMEKIVKSDLEITRRRVDKEEAIAIFDAESYGDKVRLYESLDIDPIDIYDIGGHIYSYHGYLAPSTGYVQKFTIKYYHPGALILFPTTKSKGEIPEFNDMKKLSKIFEEASKWANILDIGYLGSLNEKILQGEIGDIVKISEALHEKKVAEIADEISKDEDIQIILIAGPTSSGKTSFANRLAIQLQVNGKKPVAISLDDYFVNREDSPLNEDGSYDFESIDAIDLEKINEDLINLMEGKEIELPKFNFITGKREMSGRFIKVDKNHPIIIEGIHGLNPDLTRAIPNKNKYKVYISALTQLNIDSHNRIATTDTRLIRRIVRDNKFRGNDINRSFELWEGVRPGEEKYIFPYQEEADVIFNSALVYELSVLKKHIEPLLKTVKKDSKYYGESKKLLSFLKYFRDIEDESIIPLNSILREFIGGSYFDVH